MPIFNTLEEALTSQPTMRYSLFHYTEKTPAPSRSNSSKSLEKQYRKATMPLSLPRPTLNRNFCGGSGSIHVLSPLLEGDASKEAIELDELEPADDPKDAGKKVRVDEKLEAEKGKKKVILRKRQMWFKGDVEGESEEAGRQTWMLKCSGK